jgi:GNAT superfamily N-acetyltransferase
MVKGGAFFVVNSEHAKRLRVIGRRLFFDTGYSSMTCSGNQMNEIVYSELNKRDIPEAHALVRKVYDEFLSGENTRRGNEVFYDFIKNENAEGRLSENSFALAARNNNRICGMIEIKNYNHVCLLFVQSEMQNRGIAKTLYQKALAKCIRKNSNFIDVNSSLYAVPVYEKLGFKKTGDKTILKGIQFVPMLHKFIPKSGLGG